MSSHFLTPDALDRFFPYVCFGYGAVMSFASNVPVLDRLAIEKIPAEWAAKWRSHRTLGYVCLGVGATWILQNLWLT